MYTCCEFASNIVSLTYRIQLYCQILYACIVVNCFQNCIFDISNTAGYIQYAVFQEFESKIRIEKVFE